MKVNLSKKEIKFIISTIYMEYGDGAEWVSDGVSNKEITKKLKKVIKND